MRLRSRYLAGLYLRYRRVWMKVPVGAFDWAIETLDHRHGFSPPKASRNLCCVEALRPDYPQREVQFA